MGRMKELICNKADEVALFKYGKDFYELTKEQQDGVQKEAERLGTDYLASQLDTYYERVKYGE